MKHTWMVTLNAPAPARTYSSLGTRRQAEALIGKGALDWALCMGQRMADHILYTLLDWPGHRGDEELEALRRATEASSVDTLAALVGGDHQILALSTEPNENTAYYVRHEIPLDQVVRNVHAGQQFITQELLACVEQLVSAEERLTVARHLVQDIDACWSVLTQSVSVRYEAEYAQWRQSKTARLSTTVRQILQGNPIDSVEATASLGYAMDQWHVGISMWLDHEDVETAQLFAFDRIATEMARLFGADGGHLVVGEGSRSWHVWLGFARQPDGNQRPASMPLPSALRIAFGSPGYGASGFRQSHREAAATERVGRLSRSDENMFAYPDVELVSLLLEDIERGAAFVRNALGPLAENNSRMAELRRTLACHIDTSGSLAQTAEALYTHRNTVSYRLQQIKRIVPDGRKNHELRCALELAELIPHLVLVQSMV